MASIAAISRQTELFVATSSKHVAAEVSRKARASGLTTTVIQPIAAKIVEVLAKSPRAIIVLDAAPPADTWLAILTELRQHRSDARVVVFGCTADLQAVARAILAGASHFLVPATSNDEFASAISAVASGQQPTDQCVFGRVAAALPVATGNSGFVCGSGTRMSVDQAVKRCEQFGLSSHEIASCLRLDPADVEAITRQARKVPRVSPRLSHFAIGAAVLMLCGCSYVLTRLLFSAGVMRYRLSGVVTFDGVPVPRGTITFTSKRDGEHYSGYAGITDGKFDTQRDGKGHVGGSHAIAVIGFEESVAKHDEQASPAPLFEPIEWEEPLQKADAVLKIALPRSAH